MPLESGQALSGLGLRSSRISERLNQVDCVRANGVGDHIPLPQLVVCGDQSAGKSSVLVGISGIPFPRQDGLCTRFATEIILRHEPREQRTTATIIPNMSRAEDEKTRLSAFRRDISDLADLPGIIDQAASLMGVKDSPAFAADVLRLEVAGDTGLHLTLVDLPGLISVSENEEDVQLVGDLSIIQRARRFDKDGLRTVGIITKPDLINDGTESRVAKLANNADRTKLKLGFFLLKNPKPSELQKGMTMAERRKAEQQFLRMNLGRSLDSILHDLLDRHIERELPKVRKDVAQLLNKINKELMNLGAERTSPAQIRMYLTRISTDFQNLVRAGVEGVYGSRDAFFHEITNENEFHRLRAVIHIENGKFSNYMREHGQKRRVVSAEDQEDVEPESGQILVTEEEMSMWIKKIYYRTRGRELPGNYSPVLLAELFHAQSARWSDIARDHVNVIADLVSRFVQSVLVSVINDTDVWETISRSISATLDENKARNDRSKKDLGTSLDNAINEDWKGRFHVSNSSYEISRLATSLQNHRVIVDMEERACSEAQTDLGAYYKVAMKTFVDNICRQVIERHIINKLPDVFSPVTVSGYSDEDLLCLAAESPQLSKRRVEATQLKKGIEDSLRELR
ncbi:putative dynamin GTPase [Aspergillus tanneri]|uniref:GED domain-containing protein n=1 Tax=Aspergillus tanneri TaxID=1220188 RepID=A0A5M9M3R8_9EURO|nr:uncharacterized protein ATNIH1004_011808 [Aspergillus tanneri]KAA8641672.1 hypothetical protein ATNIH1004_011808 [Aspergillus tanneri]